MERPRTISLPVEVRLALEVQPCQSLRRTYDSAAAPHPCAYFGECGAYHSYDYTADDPPPGPGIVHPINYVGKTGLVPEVLSGCRKAPIMAVGINPNLPGYWPAGRNALNPYFDDFLQYAHYFRYRGVAKLQIPHARYEELRGNRPDGPDDPEPLTAPGSAIPAEPQDQTMYVAYQSLLDGLAQAR